MKKSGAGLAVVGALLCAVLSLSGLLAMTGTLRALLSPPLSAEVHLTDFALPKGFGLEPQVVADFLVAELTKRAETDLALRLALGDEGQKKMIEVGIPRLVSSTVVRGMIRDIKPLSDVLSVGAFKLAARVVVSNRGQGRKDVVLTMPGAVLVEAETGTASIETTSTGLTALTLGEMAPGEQRVLRVWLGQVAVEAGAGFARQVVLGDGSGAVGRVWIAGQGPWQGADLQVLPVARWIVAGVLLMAFVVSALFAAVTLMARLSGRRKVSPA